MKLSFSSKNQPEVVLAPDVILASQSIGRRYLLEKLGLRFRTAVTRLDEDRITDPNPLKTIAKRAVAKATEVVNNPRVYSVPEDRDVVVIAADSMAVVGKKTYGKAVDKLDAARILKELMDKTHTFTTTVHVVHMVLGKVKKTWTKTMTTRVTLRKLTGPELESYIARYDFSRFAAGYSINETPWDLITKIDGSYTNVIGLPFEVLLPILRTLKIII
ncbi:MAG TPA: Maf family protein [Patescibacteria group bacterium]|nr:Maf family protein [Patescibacteria group bacterium]